MPSSTFNDHRAPPLPHTLPPPAEIRALNVASNKPTASSFNCPPPVTIPSLGLVVKYGADITIVEARTQIMLREKLQGRVPVPEVFGWEEDGEQGFIYMELIEGDTLMERWDELSEDEIRGICGELRDIMQLVRGLEQDLNVPYIGSLGKQPLKDLFITHYPELNGPFEGANAVEQFQETCGIWIADKTPIVFTHNDLFPPNILISPGPNPKVTAILDWAQAGWYPAYWEYCKARWVRVNPRLFSDAAMGDWRTKYLPLILDPVDEETFYHPWIYFVLSKGC